MDNFDYFLEVNAIDISRLIKEIVNQDDSRLFYFKDKQSRFLYVNDAFVKKFNFNSREDLIGKTDADIFNYYPEHAKLAYEDEQEIIRTGKALNTLEYEGIREGIEQVVRTSKYPLHDHHNNICGTFGVSEDISNELQIIQQDRLKEQALSEEIEHLNEKINEDSLSKLRNTRYAKKRYKYLYQEYLKTNTPFSIILLDSDNFKQVNDELGHVVGDKVIRYIGKTLKHIRRYYDYEMDCCRIGGDEFLIIIPEADIKIARELAFCIRDTFHNNPFIDGNTTTAITFSMGVGEIQLDELLEDFLHRVDTHLYRAKRNGKDNIDFNVSNLI